MNTKTYLLDIDFADYSNRKDVVQKLIYDESDINTAFIQAKLLINNETIDLTNSRVSLSILKNDGHKILNECTVLNAEEGLIQISFSRQALSVVGINYFQLYIIEGLNQIVSPRYYYRVEQTMINYDDIVSSDEYGALSVLISQVEDLLNQTNVIIDRVDNLETIVKANESIRQSQETARQKQENARQESIVAMRGDIDSKITEATDIINQNTSKVDSKIAELTSVVNDKLLEVDATVSNKMTESDTKILEMDNKIIETTNITNQNTSKIDSKIVDIQSQLDVRVADKFVQVDNTLTTKLSNIQAQTDKKITELDTVKTTIVNKVDTKLGEVDDRVSTALSSGTVDLELKDARTDIYGTTHACLNDRLNIMERQFDVYYEEVEG